MKEHSHKYLWTAIVLVFSINAFVLALIASSFSEYNQKVAVYNERLENAIDDYNQKINEYNRESSSSIKNFNNDLNEFVDDLDTSSQSNYLQKQIDFLRGDIMKLQIEIDKLKIEGQNAR